MLIIISPAKKLDVETPAPLSAFTEPEFLDTSRELVNSLRMMSAEELGRMMKINPALSELNARRYRYWHTPFTLENAKAIQFDRVNGHVIHVQFREQRDDGYKIIGIHAKKARGLMSRFVIQNRIDTPEGIKQFDQAGYRYRSDMSSTSDWVFAR